MSERFEWIVTWVDGDGLTGEWRTICQSKLQAGNSFNAVWNKMGRKIVEVKQGLPSPPEEGSRVVLAGPTGGIPGRLDRNLNFIPDGAPTPPLAIRRRRAVRTCM